MDRHWRVDRQDTSPFTTVSFMGLQGVQLTVGVQISLLLTSLLVGDVSNASQATQQVGCENFIFFLRPLVTCYKTVWKVFA